MSPHERVLRAQYERTLNTVSDEDFKKIIAELPPNQAKKLSDNRNKAAAKEKSRVHERSR